MSAQQFIFSRRPVSDSSDSLFSTVRSLPNNPSVVEHFRAHKLNIGFVKWEDTARSKDSVWGPNISDVTLDVDGQSFPIIGTENFQDPTFDMPIDRFVANVGNETLCSIGNEPPLTRISFKDYLQNLGQYVSSTVKGSMYLPRDEKILTTAQSCILPLHNGKVDFNVRIHNYQYDQDDPAVLVVVMSPHGTSAQLITDYKQRIYFNKCGRKAPYVAERLTDVRAAAGKSTVGPMTQEEKERNVLFIAQIPLKQKERPQYRQSLSAMSMAAPQGVPEMSMRSSASLQRERGIDNAQLSIGESVGPWTGTSPRYTLERDPRYPIRMTIQYYRVTDSDEISDATIDDISRQIWKLYEEAPTAEKGSLVVNPPVGRVTEPVLPSRPVTPPRYVPWLPFFKF